MKHRYIFRLWLGLCALCALCGELHAASFPAGQSEALQRRLPSGATQYDLVNGTFNIKSGDTVTFKPGSFLLVPYGSTPSPLANGQIWATSAGLYVRINGVTIGPLGTGGGGGGGTWGSITGTLSDQSDLAAALSARLLAASNLSDVANAATARANLGLTIGTHVQAQDSDLAAIAALTTTSFGRALLELANAAALRSAAGLVIGTDVQAFNSNLSSFATVTPSANGLSLVSAANYAAMKALLDLEIGTDVQAYDADLANIAALSTTSFGRSFLELANAAAGRTLLGLIIGTDVQAYDADLAAIAGLTTTTFGRSLLTQADAAAARSTLGLANLSVHGNAGATETIDATYSDHSLTLDANCTITLTGWPASGSPRTIVLEILQDATGSRTITWPGAVVGSTTLSSAANSVTFIALYSRDGGTIVYASSSATSAGGSGDLLAANNLSDVANAATARANLGLTIGTHVQAYDADLTSFASVTPSANGLSFVSAANYSAMRTLLSLVVGTDVQAYDADLTTWAGVTPGTNVAAAIANALNGTGGLVNKSYVDGADASLLAYIDGAVAAAVNDTAYDATSWNGNNNAPSKNTVRDKIEAMASETKTLTNKRITARVTTITSSATPIINTDDCDAVTITALAAAITSMTTNLTGTPANFDMLMFRIKDDGTARAITWGSSFEAKGAALPTTTVISKVLTALFIYDTVTSKWGCVSTAQES